MAKIMLVDDEAEIVSLLSVILSMYGYDVTGYTDAVQALEAAPRDLPDLLLVDLMMPGMDGLQFVSCLDRLPGLSGTPVLLLTGLPPTSAQHLTRLNGPGFGILEKPCAPDQIANEVRRLLDQAEQDPDYRQQVSAARAGVSDCRWPDFTDPAA